MVMPLIEALRMHGELIRKHFMAQPAVLGRGEILRASRGRRCAAASSSTFPPGVEVKRPIELHQWLGGVDSSPSRTH